MSVPRLNLALPRPVTSLHQIEMTSICNLRCVYCVHPKMPRPKLHMERATWEAALSWVRYFRDRGTQGELNLAGIGESTIHPEFISWLPEAREAVGGKSRLVMATNGVAFTDEIARACADVNVRVTVSLHRPEVAALAVQRAKKLGILEGVSADPSLNPNDWAGQVDWPVDQLTAQSAIACPWIRGGWVFALADGRISRCCLDADGSGVIYKAHTVAEYPSAAAIAEWPVTVADEPSEISTAPWKLCSTCYQEIGIVGYEQRKGALPVIQ